MTDALGRPIIRLSLKDQPEIWCGAIGELVGLEIKTRQGMVTIVGTSSELKTFTDSLYAAFMEASHA